MDTDDIDIFSQKQAAEINQQAIQYKSTSNNTSSHTTYKIPGTGTYSVTTGLYSTYTAPYSSALINIIEQQYYEQGLEYINNELLINWPCYACNALAYITAPLTLCLSVLCINQLCYSNVERALYAALQQVNSINGSNDKNAGIKYKWVLQRSRLDSYLGIQPIDN